MDKQFHLKTVLLGAFVLLAFAYVGGILIAKERVSSLRTVLMVQAADQRALLNTIAETTARNGADVVTEAIVKDCSVSERTAFDALLSRLDSGLGQSELVTLERLFGRCGSFYAERKSVMVARLDREVEIYKNYVQQLETIGGADIDSYNVPLWEELAKDEKRQSEVFSSLVSQQDQIISTLMSGRLATSEEVLKILAQVKTSQQELADSNASAAQKRAQLISL